jgi:alpha-tubulin suppressor-like RCC1 family protein
MSSSSSSSQHNVVVGFGTNYYHNMGPSSLKTREHKAMDGSAVPITAFEFPPNTPSVPWEQENDDFLVDVQCTVTSTYFLTKSGKIYTCGTLHGLVRPELTRVNITLPLKCAQIATGRHFCLARMEGGLAVCSWGAGHFGQLGLGSESAPFVEHPTVVESLLPHVVGSPVASVAAGYWHSMAVTEAGLVFSFGCNRNGQCGTKPTREPPTICSPVLVKIDSTASSSSASTRTTTTSSATSTSSSSSTASSHNARKIIRIHKIVAGRSHSVALDQSGQVYCWGANQYGQCGLLTRRRGGIAAAKHVEPLAKVKIIDIAAGEAHTLALTGGGRLFAWGGCFEGQLGVGQILLMNPKPKLIGDLDFLAIEAGREWKSQQKQHQSQPSSEGSKGIAEASKSSKALAAIPRVVSVKAKGNSSFAISSVGHVYAWGCNDVGNLGLPKPDPSTLIYIDPGQPIQKTSTLRTVHTFSFDSSHNVALPQRLDCIRDLDVTSVAMSPTFLWCLGTKRQGKDDPELGRTLHDIQEAKRQQSLHIHYERILKTVDSGSFSVTRTPDASVNAAAPAKQENEEQRNNDEDGNDGAQQQALDPPGLKDSSEQDDVADDQWEEGSTSQHSSAVQPPSAPINDAFSPMTPGKKKRIFSPKKLMKSIVRRASGSSAKLDLVQNSSREGDAETKP